MGSVTKRAKVSAYIKNLHADSCDARLKAVRFLHDAGDPRALKPIKRMKAARNFITNSCMDGAEDRAIRALRPDIPVLITSGYDEAEALARFDRTDERLGFLGKPYRVAELRGRVRQLVELVDLEPEPETT